MFFNIHTFDFSSNLLFSLSLSLSLNNRTSCCSNYEFCVSCCMGPQQVVTTNTNLFFFFFFFFFARPPCQMLVAHHFSLSLSLLRTQTERVNGWLQNNMSGKFFFVETNRVRQLYSTFFTPPVVTNSLPTFEFICCCVQQTNERTNKP